jgi:hypothetical protein
VLTLEAEEGLWVEYKKSPKKGLNILPGIQVKCKNLHYGGLSLFPGEHTAKIKGQVTKIQFQRRTFKREQMHHPPFHQIPF